MGRTLRLEAFGVTILCWTEPCFAYVRYGKIFHSPLGVYDFPKT